MLATESIDTSLKAWKPVEEEDEENASGCAESSSEVAGANEELAVDATDVHWDLVLGTVLATESLVADGLLPWLDAVSAGLAQVSTGCLTYWSACVREEHIKNTHSS